MLYFEGCGQSVVVHGQAYLFPGLPPGDLIWCFFCVVCLAAGQCSMSREVP